MSRRGKDGRKSKRKRVRGKAGDDGGGVGRGPPMADERNAHK